VSRETPLPARRETPLATRRELLAAGLAAALARPSVAAAEDRDRPILTGLIAREDAAAYAYRGVDLPGVGDLAAQAGDHADALRTELQARGDHAALLSPEDLDPASRSLAEAADEERLAAAIALETDLVTSYGTAMLGLTEPVILQAVGTMLASHAQNRALLARAAR
jgi:hypothetical protein